MLISSEVMGQNSVGERLNVFLDCDQCDESHIRTELDFVNYVRDPNQADVHVFVTSSLTVFSGRQYDLSFIGLGSLDGSELNLIRVVDQDTSREERRIIINEALRLGLAPFLGQGADTDIFSLAYVEGEESGAEELLSRDPWRHWVFNL